MAQKYAMQRLNNYPVVVFHGFAGFGEDELIYKVAPYFGWLGNTNIKKYYNDLGTEFYCPSLSSVSSMWDRCCEMYAHLVGGTVDYGKAHSEKYGHKRFGRTYEALIPDWGQLDAEGKIKKINVMGHSYGGPTVRYFVHLMTVGDEAERAATPEDELSGLFKGGHANWIHSCTTLAGANDGISFMYGQEKAVRPFAKIGLIDVSFMNSIPFMTKFYDFMMDEWGITMNPQTGEKRAKNWLQRIDDYIDCMDDNCIGDLTIHRFRERSKDWECQPNIYYFAYYATKTSPNKKGYYFPNGRMFFILKPFCYLVGRYNGTKADENHAETGIEWRENDGLVNVMSGRAPRSKPWVSYTCDADIKPGMWIDMPIEDKDHMSYCGAGETREAYTTYFYEMLHRICNLPSVDAPESV